MDDFSHLSDSELEKIANGGTRADDGYAHLSDADLEKIAGTPEPQDWAGKGASFLKAAGRGAAKLYGQVSEALPDMTAPIRSGIGEYQKSGSVGNALGAATAQVMGSGQKAPDTSELLSGAGVPSGKFSLPVMKNPWGATDAEKYYQSSPAEIGGVVIDTLKDPATYLGGAAEKAAVEIPMAIGGSLEKAAANRGIKAVTGHSIKNVRKFAKVPAGGAINPEFAERNLMKAGHGLINADEAGPPAVGWLSKPSDSAAAIESKRQFYGDKIGEVGRVIDQNVPKAVNGQNIANKMLDYASNLPETERGSALQDRILKDAERFQNKKSITFAEAQKLKDDFKYKHASPDSLISDQDATNKINRIISDEMESTVDTHAKHLDDPTLHQYKEYKDKYGLYRTASDAASEESLRERSRNIASPSSKASGLTALATMAIMSHDPVKTLAAGVVGAVGNELIMKRGSAFAARTANAVAHTLQATPQRFAKWMPRLQKAAQGGVASLSVAHHLLMKSDPEYFNAFSASQGGEP